MENQISFLMGIAFMIVFFVVNRKRTKQQKQIFEELALKWNGTIKRSFLSHRLVFTHRDTEVSVYMTSGGKNSPPHTFVVTRLSSNVNYKMTICRESALTKMGKSFGMQDIQLNNPPFDESFIVKGSDESMIRSLLTEDVQKNILECKEFWPTIIILKNILSLSIPCCLKESQQYDPLIHAAFILIDKIEQFG